MIIMKNDWVARKRTATGKPYSVSPYYITSTNLITMLFQQILLLVHQTTVLSPMQPTTDLHHQANLTSMRYSPMTKLIPFLSRLVFLFKRSRFQRYIKDNICHAMDVFIPSRTTKHCYSDKPRFEICQDAVQAKQKGVKDPHKETLGPLHGCQTRLSAHHSPISIAICSPS